MKSVMFLPELSTLFGISGIVLILPLFLFFALFILILCVILRAVKKDSKFAQLTVWATVIGKRTSYYVGEGFPSMERYYVSFEMKGGKRIELSTPAREYGILFEGDQGVLSFRGSRFLDFQRERRNL